jgi:ribosomal protein L14
MIQKFTYLHIPENSGVKNAQAINLRRNYKKKYSSIGHIILISVKSLRGKKILPNKIKKKDILPTLIITTKIYKKKNYYLKFFYNNGIILNFQGQPYASKIFIPLLKSLYFRGFLRLGLLSSGFFQI